MVPQTVVIVGHGPSVLRKMAGEEIDKYFTIRLKRCQGTLKLPRVYGSRIDAVCGSWTIREGLKAIPAKQYWTFVDSRHGNADVSSWDGYVNKPLCDRWNQRFRDKRTPYRRVDGTVLCPSSTEGLGHNHLSAGFHALLYACELGAEVVRLAGFDNVVSGDFTWSVTRGPEYDKYPDHRWDIEHEMLNDVIEEYGIELCVL